MKILIIAILLICPILARAAATQAGESPKPGIFKADFNDEPTYIRANSLTLKSEENAFIYTGNVEVKQGEMILTSDILEGTYNDKNEIQQLVAKQNVVITKGDEMKALSDKATYESSTEIMTLTENPSLEQKGSLLSADVIKIFLNEDRSIAEGEVRVKLVGKGENKKQSSSKSVMDFRKKK